MFDASALDCGWGPAPGSGVGAGFPHAGRARRHGAPAPHGTSSAGTSVTVPAILHGDGRELPMETETGKTLLPTPPQNSHPRLLITKPRHDAAEAGTCDADSWAGSACAAENPSWPNAEKQHLFAPAHAALLLHRHPALRAWQSPGTRLLPRRGASPGRPAHCILKDWWGGSSKKKKKKGKTRCRGGT